MSPWEPTSWQRKPLSQQVVYANESERDAVIAQLQTMPPLVTPFEIEDLKVQLAKASAGDAFLLQGGDCAESFADCHTDIILNKLRILLQISLVLLHGLQKPIIRVGRIAGQYAKPRSSEYEIYKDQTLPIYRGDLINGAEFDAAARRPDPNRMMLGYQYSALTLNYIRSLVSHGFADLLHPEYWSLDFAKHSAMKDEYQKIVDQVNQAMGFVQTIGSVTEKMNKVDFYTSHEALHLYYEQALTRFDQQKWYNLSTHFPWIGMRTALADSSHVEYARGIANPIAVKIGPDMTSACLTKLVAILNPENEPGRLVLIHRFGSEHIAKKLPSHIHAVKATGINVLWCCDPMHGNTTITKSGYKTRRFDTILSELEQAVKIHQDHDSYLGGVHFELTGDEVTECIGGSSGLTEANLKEAYRTLVDPRLNYEQSLEMAMHLVSAYT